MEITFSKFHGAGNDFIFVDNQEGRYKLNDEHRKKMCDRHFGVGADGLVEIRSSEKADFKLLYFNSDGREGTLCGNGSRCSIAFALKIGLGCRNLSSENEVSSLKKEIEDKPEATQGSSGPRHEPRETTSDEIPCGNVLTNGRLHAEPDSLPHFVFEASDGLHFGGVSERITAGSGDYSQVFYVEMKDVELDQVKVYDNGDIFIFNGSPHHVRFVSHPIEELDVAGQGRELRYGLYGSEGCNINFVSEPREFTNDQTNLKRSNGENTDNLRNADKVTNEKHAKILYSDCRNVDSQTERQTREGINGKAIPDKKSGAVSFFARTYERGVEGETLACGTGCIAIAIADHVRRITRTDTSKNHGDTGNMDGKQEPVVFRHASNENDAPRQTGGGFSSSSSSSDEDQEKTIQMPGGCLRVTFTVKSLGASPGTRKIAFTNIKLFGPAEHVFDGVYRI